MKNDIMTIVLLALILLALAVDLVMTHATLRVANDAATHKTLPCAAIPTGFILEEPECADKLVRAMNVTNVRVLAREKWTNETH